MKALSIRQPWLWAIMHAGKRIENRDWYCGYRGPILLHASRYYNGQEFWDVVSEDILPLVPAGQTPPFVTVRMLQQTGGHLLARANVVDCLRPGGTPPAGQEAWYTGAFGIVLANVEALPEPVPCRGALGLFDVPFGASEPKPSEASPGAPTRPLVVHCKQAPFDVYVGRPSIWGNPFKLKSEADRTPAILAQYEAWLRGQPELVARARRELRGKVLGCYCAPKLCHGDVLARVANEEEPHG